MNSTEWLAKLISFNTVSNLSNLPLIYAIQDELKKYPEISMRLSYDASGEKANLFVTIPATDGNATMGGLILSGHTDVVPVEGQEWERDPFEAVVTSDRIYGRGACDMKGFIAVILALVPEFLKKKLKRPVHFAFSYDEEVGCLGAPMMIADFMEHQIRPAACVVGEPTDMSVVIGHKGITSFHCRIKGRAAHSSLTPQGCNAIEYAAHLISWIRGLANQFKQLGPFDDLYDISFSTITTNKIHGGIALNIIPEMCEFSFELRNLPEVNPKQVFLQIRNYVEENLLPQMRKEFWEAEVEIVPTCGVPGFSAENSEFIKTVEELVKKKEQRKVSYATEAGIFQKNDIATVVCGPGNIEQAHRANEFVLLEQIGLCEKFLRRLVESFGVR